MDYAIQITDLSKRFKVYHGKHRTLKDRLFYQGQQTVEELWALRDINLQLPRGASVIGIPNSHSAGMSTAKVNM